MHVFASIGLGGDNISENCYYICMHAWRGEQCELKDCEVTTHINADSIIMMDPLMIEDLSL